jgi:hypothetical protein
MQPANQLPYQWEPIKIAQNSLIQPSAWKLETAPSQGKWRGSSIHSIAVWGASGEHQGVSIGVTGGLTTKHHFGSINEYKAQLKWLFKQLQVPGGSFATDTIAH